MWQLQPLFPPWRSPALTQQPRHQYGTVEDLCSKLPVQSQTAARLARPPEAWGPMRTFGCLDDVHHQGNKYPALALAAPSVSPVFEIWHSISVPTVHPHSHWKANSSDAQP